MAVLKCILNHTYIVIMNFVHHLKPYRQLFILSYKFELNCVHTLRLQLFMTLRNALKHFKNHFCIYSRIYYNIDNSIKINKFERKYKVQQWLLYYEYTENKLTFKKIHKRTHTHTHQNYTLKHKHINVSLYIHLQYIIT